jgi:hypothetical protein
MYSRMISVIPALLKADSDKDRTDMLNGKIILQKGVRY